jgi:hypothetical protein
MATEIETVKDIISDLVTTVDDLSDAVQDLDEGNEEEDCTCDPEQVDVSEVINDLQNLLLNSEDIDHDVYLTDIEAAAMQQVIGILHHRWGEV